jgi:uncharacterized FlaG/YvyC family protein
LEDDVRFEYVITRDQDQTPAQARAEARAQARREAAEARAQAQEDAQRIREDAQRIREEAQRIRDEVRQEVQNEIQGEHGQTGVIVMPPRPPWERNDIPPHVVDVITLFFVAVVICVVGLPIARAIGRWMDRRGLPSPVNAELAAQMNRIEQAVDTMSVEVERISEAQRFQAKLLSDREKASA